MIETIETMGQPALRLSAPDGAQAVVLLHGATVVSWQDSGGVERLYLSPQAAAGPGRAVRGGVPVIFPQFAERGPGPRHGFARDRAWRVVETAERGGAAIAVLGLEDDEATRKLWPHAFAAELTVVVGGQALDIELDIVNRGAQAFTFQAALHTYLRVDDVRQARLHGLGGVAYEDMLHGGWHRQEFDTIGFVGAIDRVYVDVPGPLTLAAGGLGRLGIDADQFPDVVIWNPGADGASRLADLPDDDWPCMLCVEAGAIERPVLLGPGAEWSARQSFIA